MLQTWTFRRPWTSYLRKKSRSAIIIQGEGISLTLDSVTETDTASALVALKGNVLGQAEETDTAQTLTSKKTLEIGQAEEENLAFTLVGNIVIATPRAVETDIAFALGVLKTLEIGVAQETDTAQAFVTDKTILIGIAVELNTAQAASVFFSSKGAVVILGSEGSVQMGLNETNLLKRRVYFTIPSIDGSLALDEDGGQPQISEDGEEFTDNGISDLISIGFGRYYATIDVSVLNKLGKRILTRYKSGNTPEVPGPTITVVYNPYGASEQIFESMLQTEEVDPFNIEAEVEQNNVTISWSSDAYQFTELALEHCCSGDGILTGPHILTIIVTDDDDIAIEGVNVRVFNGSDSETKQTDVNGEVEFAVGTAVWMIAVKGTGYFSVVTSQEVEMDVTKEIALEAKPPVDVPELETVLGLTYTYDETNTIEGGIKVYVQMIQPPSGVGVFSNAVAEYTSDVNGLVSIPGMFIGAKYEIWRGQCDKFLYHVEAPEDEVDVIYIPPIIGNDSQDECN